MKILESEWFATTVLAVVILVLTCVAAWAGDELSGYVLRDVFFLDV